MNKSTHTSMKFCTEDEAKTICNGLYKQGMFHKDWDRLTRLERGPFIHIAAELNHSREQI